MRSQHSLTSAYFEGMYRGSDDPWQFATSDYEAAKYDATLAALADRAYEYAFEVGCANGVLTRRLAAHCRKLLAIDISETALSLARRRCADLDYVSFAQQAFPNETPTGAFDLIVMSEVVYYWSRADIRHAADFVKTRLQPHGDLVLVHWTGETDYPQTGDGAVNLMREELPRFSYLRADRTDYYRLDLWRLP